jgi:hypothetical protein
MTSCSISTDMRSLARILGLATAASLTMAGCELAFPVSDGASRGTPGPCSQSHRFCASFDDGPLSGHPEYAPFSQSGGSLLIDTRDARSPPGALVATCGDLPASSKPAFAFIAPKLDGSLINMRLAFEMRIDVRGSAGNPIATVGVLDGSNRLYNVQLSVDGNGRWSIGEYRPTAMPNLFSHPSDEVAGSAWMKVQFEVHVGGGDDFATLAVDNHVVLAHAKLQPSVTDGAPVMALGFTSLYGPSTPWTVRFDDVTFDD